MSHPEHGAAGKGLTCLVRFANLPADASTALGGFPSSTTLPWFGLFPVLGWPWRASLVGDDVEFAAQGPLPQNTRIIGTMQLIAASPSWSMALSIRAKDGHGTPAQNDADPSQPGATDRTYPYAHGDVGQGYYHGKTGPEYDQMFYQSFLASTLMTDLRVGVSMGAWETVITQKPDRGGRQTFTRDGEQWTATLQSHKGAGKAAERVSVRHTIPRGRLAFRLVAVADDGSEHVPYKEFRAGTRARCLPPTTVLDTGVPVPSPSLPLGRVPKHLTPTRSEDGRSGSLA